MRTEPNRSAARAVVALTLVAFAAAGPGCAARHAPSHWLSYAEEAQREAYGGWMEMERQDADSVRVVHGELLAVSDDSVYTLSGPTITATALARVPRGTLEAYDPRSGDAARMTFVGTVMSVTTGWGLILVAPAWLITGTISSSMLSHQGRHELKTGDARGSADPAAMQQARASWRDLRLFARFPQGLPPGLDRTSLHERALNAHARPVLRSDPRSIAP